MDKVPGSPGEAETRLLRKSREGFPYATMLNPRTGQGEKKLRDCTVRQAAQGALAVMVGLLEEGGLLWEEWARGLT